MPLYEVNGKRPILEGDKHFIAPSADVIGDVTLSNNSSIWFNTTIRAEYDSIRIGENTNIQDGAVLHVDPGFPLTLDDNVTIGHQVMLHGCSVGSGSLVGINAVVLNGAIIGKGCLIGANSLVTEGMNIPDGALVLGSPAKVKKIMTREQQKSLVVNANHYVSTSENFRVTLSKIDE